jgi:hypothetical protein
MCGLGPGIALGSTRVYLSLWRDPQYSSLYFPGLCARVSPTNRNVRGMVCALSHRVSTFFHIWFSQTKYFNSVTLISTPTHLPTIKLVHK